MFADLRIEELTEMCAEAGERSFLVDAHQPCGANDIGHKNCG
jgi:hypothetical protein